ncbi:MAG: type VII toxin-antitoxin system MntA family adenylyltransferase antitoxin [Candidatus Brocadia sp.]
MFDIKKLEKIFKDYPYIASAYLFGSYSSGKAGPMSDVDIAILLKGNAPAGRELIHEEDYLAYRIEKAIGVNQVDLIDLNSQGLIFCHNVLKTGKLIYNADTAFRVRFETQVISSFCDFEPTLSFMERFHFQGIKKRCISL